MQLLGVYKGADIGLYSVQVLVETPEECATSEDTLQTALEPLLLARGIDPAEVLSVNRYMVAPDGTRVAI